MLNLARIGLRCAVPLAVTGLALCPLAVPMETARAATTCSGQTESVVYDGTGLRTTTYGTDGYLDTHVGALCTTNNPYSLSAAWTMLTGGAYRTDGWTQAGILTTPTLGNGSQMYEFSEWSEYYTGSAVYLQTPSTVTGTHEYHELYDFNTGTIGLYVDSTQLDRTNFDPAAVWTAPWINDWYGEVGDPGDDVPGSSSSPEHFSSLGYKPCRSCGWTSPTGLGLSSGSSRYSYAWDTQYTAFHIWTSS